MPGESKLELPIMSLFLRTVLPFLILSAFLTVLILIKRLIYMKKLKKLSKAGIQDIDKMDGKTFEQYLESIFKNNGYKVERTPYKGDFGGDLIVSLNGKRTVIQAKRWNSKVGVKAIQEAVAAKGYYNCDHAVVVTNSTFTPQAIELAGKNGVELWDRKNFLKELEAYAEKRINKNIKNETSHTDVVKCVNCGKTMTQKEISYCTRFAERFSSKMYCYKCQKKVKSI